MLNAKLDPLPCLMFLNSGAYLNILTVYHFLKNHRNKRIIFLFGQFGDVFVITKVKIETSTIKNTKQSYPQIKKGNIMKALSLVVLTLFIGLFLSSCASSSCGCLGPDHSNFKARRHYQTPTTQENPVIQKKQKNTSSLEKLKVEGNF